MGDENERNMTGKNKKNKTGVRQREKNRSPLKQLDLNAKLITNQIDSALLTESLIDDLRNCDGQSEQTIKELAKQCKSLTADAQLLLKEKTTTNELVKQLKE